MKKKKIGLSFLVVTLALLVTFSLVAISHLLLKTGKQNPYANIDISASDSDNNNDNDNKTESAVSESETPEVELVGGKNGVYHKEIQIFYAEYGNDGKISVKSEFGDKVVAPGTENQYDLYVRNVGEVPISYVLEAQSFLTVNIDGKQIEIPIEASFSAPNNNYLLGGEDNLEHLAQLDGVNDSSGLSPKHQAKYTLHWNWPFEGDDELDTLLGNLADEGEELKVKVAFNLTAVYDPDAEGGSPITGDLITVRILVALFVITVLFGLILLLFWKKREQDEENA
ncbi:MAG: hypothetical protein ACI4U6_02465 [Acutalibacteraceae bacterium]